MTTLHGGRVAANSAGIEHGAHFTVWLPLAVGTSTNVPSIPSAELALKSLRLLIVDDEPDLLAAFGMLLESEGAVVTLAGSADQALDIAGSDNRFDAVISDLAMPEKDGYWLATQLRLVDASHDVPMLAASGMARPVDRERARDAGFDALLGKPLDLNALRFEVLQALAKRSALRS